MSGEVRVPVNKIIPFSLVDGPGSRTAIFLQACNLHCAYCHNPETQRLCNGCGDCLSVCPVGALTLAGTDARPGLLWDAARCIQCDACIQACSRNSSPKIQWMTAEDVFYTIEKNMPFIRGISVSGGECVLYPAFLKQLFARCKATGLGCLMDTNGAVPLWEDEDLFLHCDGAMLDVKSWSDSAFLKLTGGDAAVLRKNLAFLRDRDKLEELRIVCLKDYVDAEDAIRGSAEILGAEASRKTLLKLIRFRQFGVKGELAAHPSPGLSYMQKLANLASEVGFQRVRII